MWVICCCPALASRRRPTLLSYTVVASSSGVFVLHHLHCALSRGFVVAYWCLVILRPCCVIVPCLHVVDLCCCPACHHCDMSTNNDRCCRSVWLSVRGVGTSLGHTHQTGTMNDDIGHHLSFGCHVTISDMAPGFCMKGVSVSIHEWLFGFVGKRLG